MNITREDFGTTKGGEKVELFTLNNGKMSVKITNYGGIITAINMSDKRGNFDNVVLGFDKFDDYISDEYISSGPYFGAIIGRCANRIAKGKFSLHGKDYTLAVNNGENHLHGGLVGFDKRVWKAETLESDSELVLKLSLFSADMEEGYPGNLNVTVTYILNSSCELILRYEATTDKDTVVNLTNHSYFNLTGGRENIFNHTLQMNASQMTEGVDLIPTGRIVPVEGTPFDFTEEKKIGRDIPEHLEVGYDNNYVVDSYSGSIKQVATLQEESSGRVVAVSTDMPGTQIYTGYYIPEYHGRFGKYSGVAIETQFYPDSINRSEFPSVVLKEGDKFTTTTIFKFGIK
ncbi:MAG: aldose epimerase family protein [Bacteroidales bacterium]